MGELSLAWLLLRIAKPFIEMFRWKYLLGYLGRLLAGKIGSLQILLEVVSKYLLVNI